MTDETSNLVLEHLHYLRAKFDVFGEDLALVKTGLSSLEGQVAGLHHQVALVHGDRAMVHQRMDLVDTRLGRIERRLDLAESPAS